MQIHLSPRHLTLTAAIHGHVADKMNHLETLADNILGAHVVLLHDETKTKKFIVKVHVGLPGPDVHAEQASDDLYSAIDLVTDKLAQQLRKRKTRTRDAKKHRTQLATESKKRGYTRR
ncbi:putative sigma-54 modulation protein [Terrimicrobium sacchariphilum]|jgi:putative sigma-54 modulation protein|uniref:Ribosome hibernation promoting factor n=1 Tax=Terrimicrobium sacchariphilum TaxID=690879 RepID=A0A146GB57_TERSA|nr:ribosome-associated translation inhibitor RaiA [Terrimicrobium sacchariphilum]GAT34463.1 putative sigma-54 modulation protein [Terrimicrobium sacchariphilum]